MRLVPLICARRIHKPNPTLGEPSKVVFLTQIYELWMVILHTNRLYATLQSYHCSMTLLSIPLAASTSRFSPLLRGAKWYRQYTHTRKNEYQQLFVYSGNLSCWPKDTCVTAQDARNDSRHRQWPRDVGLGSPSQSVA